MSRPHRDLVGHVFGRLTVLRSFGRAGHDFMWVCRCFCDGKEVLVRQGNLLSGCASSCGCFRSEKSAQRIKLRHKENLVHGHTGTAVYHIWDQMVQRCTNSNHAHWSNYGGAGINICARWLKFANFLADMGERPSPEHSLSRFLDIGDYRPENVEWATWADQGAERKGKHAMLAYRTARQNGFVWDEEFARLVA